MRIRTYIFTHYLHHSAFAASALPFLVWTLNNIFEYTIHLECVFWNISLSTLSVKYPLTCGCSICPIYMNKIQIYKCVPLVYSLFFHLFFCVFFVVATFVVELNCKQNYSLSKRRKMVTDPWQECKPLKRIANPWQESFYPLWPQQEHNSFWGWLESQLKLVAVGCKRWNMVAEVRWFCLDGEYFTLPPFSPVLCLVFSWRLAFSSDFHFTLVWWPF